MIEILSFQYSAHRVKKTYLFLRAWDVSRYAQIQKNDFRIQSTVNITVNETNF